MLPSAPMPAIAAPVEERIRSPAKGKVVSFVLARFGTKDVLLALAMHQDMTRGPAKPSQMQRVVATREKRTIEAGRVVEEDGEIARLDVRSIGGDPAAREVS